MWLWAERIGRAGLGAVLLYASYTKLKFPWISFAATVESYKILPDAAVMPVARALPWVELSLGVLLVLGFGLRWVGTAASALLLAFFTILARAYALGMQIDCGCFGPADILSWKTLVRDGALVALAVAVTASAFVRARRAVQAGAAADTV